MKKLIFPLFVFAMASCNTSTDTRNPEMPGVYFMQSQMIDNGTNKIVLRELKQLKIYTDTHFMYTQANPKDSTYSFGVGTYSVGDSGTVIENVVFSAGDSSSNADSRTYHLHIVTNFDGYKQTIPEIIIGGEKSVLTEEYTRSGAEIETPLDGVWKETNFYIVNGNDSVAKDRVQYKAFYHGYFMYGQFNTDSLGKSTAMGYGAYKMENDNQIVETDLNSSYNIIPGQKYTIDIEMNNENSYKQTLTQADGSKHIEIYERLKN